MEKIKIFYKCLDEESEKKLQKSCNKWLAKMDDKITVKRILQSFNNDLDLVITVHYKELALSL